MLFVLNTVDMLNRGFMTHRIFFHIVTSDSWSARNSRLRCNSVHLSAASDAMLINNQLVGVVVDVQVFSVHDDFVAKELAHLLKGNIFRFRKIPVYHNGTQTRDYDED